MSTGKRKLNKADFMFKKRTNEVLVKAPGAVAGQQFMVADLSGCTVYVLDHSAVVTADACSDCTLVFGPVEGSFFLRDCTNCTVIVAAGQLRTRDCRDCDIFLFAASDPIIEASTAMVFHHYNAAYPGLSAHFAAAGLDPAVNRWTAMYDFSREDDSLDQPHYTILDTPDADPAWAPAAFALPGPDAPPPDTPIALLDNSAFVYSPDSATVVPLPAPAQDSAQEPALQPAHQPASQPAADPPSASPFTAAVAAAPDSAQGDDGSPVATAAARARAFIANLEASAAEATAAQKADAADQLAAFTAERQARIDAAHTANADAEAALALAQAPSSNSADSWSASLLLALTSAPPS
ncbi:uncharacterized protein AMSG_10468 [Thecamonas trahens ATCC 50062]|uniref:C-CAP/cofactor C-like domain-containing protein n=1 Tax=Thecamonas trahens ATCC 50062 TaxID=461836 RepID=A0A0L0DR29_THETB|nr:hypothetical protein AMSG_10468 [Thecamonas trahens ATCC 50062]KNC54471.1 hypothetical protein AMSG_10468 [Thecamonas trahens ATCC 50062]|eukprot:XP_013753626.1 hypothetical protein AMSG_10468 [Thecamonas trahens ATCC 50062]